MLAALAMAATACHTDDATQVNYGIYATPDLLEVANVEVRITNSDGKIRNHTLTIKDFAISHDYHIQVNDTTPCLYWSTSDHFDMFGVGSEMTVTYIPIAGVDLSAYTTQAIFGQGIVGEVITTDKDGDTAQAPIYQPATASVFNLPTEATAAEAYLTSLSQSPTMVCVEVSTSGIPTVTYK